MASGFATDIEQQLPGGKLLGKLTTSVAIDFTNASTTALAANTTIGGSSVIALTTITSVSANALTAGPAGTTNPSFNVDASTASAATGLNVKSAAAAGGLAVSVISSGTNENLTIDAKGSGTITLNGTGTGNVLTSVPVVMTTASATAFAVGRLGSTTPVFLIDASTGTQVAGLKLTGAATGGTVALIATDSGSNTSITFDGKGTGTFGINTTATNSGLVTIGNSTSLAGAAVNGLVTVTAAVAGALTVGRQGATNPVLKVDASAATVVTGLSIKGAATGAGVALAAISSSAAEPLTIDALGTGRVDIGSISTGIVVTSRGARKASVNNGTLVALGTVQNTTPTAAQLIGGFLSHNSTTGGGTATLDNGTNISAQVPGVAIGDSFTCVYANIGSQTVTITGATGSTVVGTAAIPTGKNATMTFYNTGSNTWNVYCMVSA